MKLALSPRFNLKRFLVGEGPQAAPYYLSQRRVYILPTKQGFAFTFLLFVMLLGSINYSNSLGYFLTFLLASLLVVSIFHTYNNLLHLSIGAAVYKPVFANTDPGGFSVTVDNRQHAARFAIQAFTPQNLRTETDLLPNQHNTLYIQHKFSRRGLIPLPRFTLETRYPFGLFRAWTLVEFAQKQLVYPQPSPDKFLPHSNTGASEGNISLDNGVDDFKGLRTFVAGDPLHHIHWKNYARHQTLQTKEYSATTANELWLNWTDTTGSHTEHKLSQLTRWVILAHELGVNFGLRLPDQLIPAGSGKQHFDSCLKQLALYGSNEVTA